MKTRTFFLAASFISVLTFSSCSKKDKIDPPSKTDLLTAKPWVIQKNETRENGGPWINVWPFEPACEQDDKWIFSNNMSVTLNTSALACSGELPNNNYDVLRWSFSNNETELVIDGITSKIVQLDENQLVIYASQTVGGDFVENRITYGH